MPDRFVSCVRAELTNLSLWTRRQVLRKRIRSGGTFVDWPLPAVGESQLLSSVVPLRAPTGTGESVAR